MAHVLLGLGSIGSRRSGLGHRQRGCFVCVGFGPKFAFFEVLTKVAVIRYYLPSRFHFGKLNQIPVLSFYLDLQVGKTMAQHPYKEPTGPPLYMRIV